MDSEKLPPNKIKEEIIKIFKDEKMDVTNILQKELKEQVLLLNKEMVKLKLKKILIQINYRMNSKTKIILTKKKLMITMKRSMIFKEELISFIKDHTDISLKLWRN